MIRVLFSVCVLSVLSAVCFGEEPRLNADTHELDHCTLVLDHKLAENRDEIAAMVDDLVVRLADTPEIDRRPSLEQARRIYDALVELTGQSLPEAERDVLLDKQAEILHKTTSPASVLEEHPTVYLLGKETSKAYLRQGGELPYLGYDAEQDRANYSFGFTFTASSEKRRLSELLFPLMDQWDKEIWQQFEQIVALYCNRPDLLVGDGELDESVLEQFHAVRAMGEGMVAIGVSQALMKAIMPWREVDQTCWLYSGAIYQYAQAGLRGAGLEDSSRLFPQLVFDAAPGAPDPSPLINLRVWSMTVGPLLDSEGALGAFCNKREAASHAEVGRLIQAIGWDAFRQLLAQLAEAQIGSGTELEALVRQTTGYDISSRLDLYQLAADLPKTFETALVRASHFRDSGDLPLAMVYLTIALESQLWQDNPQVDPRMVLLIMQLAKQLGDQVGTVGALRVLHKLSVRGQVAGDADNKWAGSAAYTLGLMIIKEDNLGWGIGMYETVRDMPWPDPLPEANAGLLQLYALAECQKLLNQDKLDEAEALLSQTTGEIERITPPAEMAQALAKYSGELAKRLEALRREQQGVQAN